ncbi:hypothetical protein ABTY53_14740 [Streptomyces noursei]|uniref:hypothetical protein n=1 Tax=Streptomyces noursei TaxID=1971 RepID=UPI00331C5E8E
MWTETAPERASASTSSSSPLAGAVAASRHLPAEQGAELLHTARAAFTVGLHVTGVIAAVLFAGLAVLIVAMRPTPSPTTAVPTAPVDVPDYEAIRA